MDYRFVYIIDIRYDTRTEHHCFNNMSIRKGKLCMNENKNTAEERQSKIVELLLRDTKLVVTDLAKELDVTEATIRRDLTFLETEGKLYRTHGGAIFKEQPVSWEITSLDNRNSLFHKEKLRIARYAASLVNNSDTIMLDGGSTTLLIAKELAKTKRNLMVVTNSPIIGEILISEENGNHVFTTGGELVYRTQNLMGAIAEKTLASYFVDKTFIGVTGIMPEEGFFSANPQESEIKRLMVQNAKESFIVSDSSKIGRYAFCLVSVFSQVNGLITDLAIHHKDLETLQREGLNVYPV
jgi:DeoR family transcriptional regulator, fructose operon transcriptional repressor